MNDSYRNKKGQVITKGDILQRINVEPDDNRLFYLVCLHNGGIILQNIVSGKRWTNPKPSVEEAVSDNFGDYIAYSKEKYEINIVPKGRSDTN